MNANYDAEAITVLEGLEPVRRRPGMYIGGTGHDGFHHLLWEIVDNAVDEAIGGFASRIIVELDADGAGATVSDNGRGIPVAVHPKVGVSALQVILTTLHAGGKFGGSAYTTSGGLHGVGSSVVNALSSSLTATIRRDGFEWEQSYRRGAPRGPVQKVKPARASGTRIRFTPDPEIFGELRFSPDEVCEQLEIKAFLNKGLRIAFKDCATGKRQEFHHEGGVADFLAAQLAADRRTSTTERVFTLERDAAPRLHLAMCWSDAPHETFRSFVNGIPTRSGGTHEQGIKDAIARAIRAYIDTHDVAVPRKLKISTDDIREGVVAVASIFLAEPQFQGQTKDRLNNPEVRSQVESLVRPALERWLNTNRSLGDAILRRVIMAARARQASRDATEQIRRKSPVSRRLNLPGKLADCSTSDPSQAELFIVEGDSAGGSAKQGRDRRNQAILPLRGKVLNTEQASLKKINANRELSDIVKALGCGIGAGFDASKLRYHRIILLMDADSDGHHIATLLLTFFYRHLRPLVDGGYVYLAQPPLYRIDVGKKTWWASDDAEKARIIRKLPSNAKPEISRFKGLGEMMPKTLFRTTLDPRRRRLLQVGVEPAAELPTERLIGDLMGRDPQARLREINQWMEVVETLDI